MRREWGVAIAIAALAIVLAFVAPSYFSAENLPDLFLVKLPVLVGAQGATLVVLTRWMTQGAWVETLPPHFQWLGFTQASFPIATGCGVAALFVATAWGMRNIGAGRAVYATGSNVEAARLASIDTALVKLSVFTVGGALTGLAALLNSVRFNQIPSNSGLGLEMKVIASVVVGGAAVTGGRGTLAGTLLGVMLLGAIGPAL